eukprot:gnl/TRDRNA2_/TRDRNA2_176576_c3_seq10.p1 gnl/TRDRNA2_/TRDRNA2_176576_c3~~gnl/TRDRNA2_/TRDRNA2_176576_c3_seq10.p1  ORF type:complete len:224 (-),score=24.83 gnl/TRDRNA2_/TRDRNA2_176576_c3_seq10:4-675(-)
MRILCSCARPLLRIAVLVSYADCFRVLLRRNDTTPASDWGDNVTGMPDLDDAFNPVSGISIRVAMSLKETKSCLDAQMPGTCSMRQRDAPLSKDVTYANTNDLIHNYMQEHKLDSTNESTGRLRPIVVGMLSTCSDIFGNEIHGFLNALAFAVVADYTFVMNITGDCASFLTPINFRKREYIKSLDYFKQPNVMDIFEFLKRYELPRLDVSDKAWPRPDTLGR